MHEKQWLAWVGVGWKAGSKMGDVDRFPRSDGIAVTLLHVLVLGSAHDTPCTLCNVSSGSQDPSDMGSSLL